MRQNRLDQAEEILGTMDDVYDLLMDHGFPRRHHRRLRRTTDMLRGGRAHARGSDDAIRQK